MLFLSESINRKFSYETEGSVSNMNLERSLILNPSFIVDSQSNLKICWVSYGAFFFYSCGQQLCKFISTKKFIFFH